MRKALMCDGANMRADTLAQGGRRRHLQARPNAMTDRAACIEAIRPATLALMNKKIWTRGRAPNGILRNAEVRAD